MPNTPHEDIFNIRQRNAAQREVRNRADAIYFGTPIEAAASTPYVSERQVRHEPTTGHHSHDHAGYGAGDHDDGIHFHMHEHNNDSDHDHAHTHSLARPPERERPGRAE